MNHQITTKTTGDEWEQTMVCGFANATIALLVYRDANLREGYLNKARVNINNDTITLTRRFDADFLAKFDNWPCLTTFRVELEALAKDWQEQEKTWLPIMRYFHIAKEKHNQALREWGKKHDERLDDLEYQIKGLTDLFKSYQGYTEATNCDILDCLDMDFNAIERLREALPKKGLIHRIIERISLYRKENNR